MLQCFECRNAMKLCNGMMFNFFPYIYNIMYMYIYIYIIMSFYVKKIFVVNVMLTKVHNFVQSASLSTMISRSVV